jgi:hypothetical protein
MTTIAYDAHDPATAYDPAVTYVTNGAWSSGTAEWWENGDRIIEVRPFVLDREAINEMGGRGVIHRSADYGRRFASREEAQRFLYEQGYTAQWINEENR